MAQGLKMDRARSEEKRPAGTPGPDGRPISPDAEGDEEIDNVPLYRKKRVLIPFFILILAVALGVWYWYKNLRNFVSTDDAYVDADRVAISAKLLGRISRLAVDEGSLVKKGDILVQLDDADVRAQAEQAKANLAFAQDSLPLAKVNLDRAKDDFERAETQFQKAIVTKEQYVHAQKAFEAAQAEYTIATSKISVAIAQLGVVETQMQNMVMIAPFDGIVAKRWLMEGDVVQPAQPILTIYDLQQVWVTANLEETKLGRVKLQDTVEIAVDMYPHRLFSGRVFVIGDYTASEFSLIPPSNASGNFTKITQRVPLKISLDNLTPDVKRDFPMRPGMSVEIKIKIR
jgi:membrane fusion protein (multidrug efflux system)